MFSIGEGSDAAVLSTNLVEGAFPPFEDVIPKDQDKKVTFDASELASAIRQAALLTNEESKGVRMSFKDKMLTLTSRAPEMGEAEIHMDLDKYDGDPLEIGFNPGFIVDALKSGRWQRSHRRTQSAQQARRDPHRQRFHVRADAGESAVIRSNKFSLKNEAQGLQSLGFAVLSDEFASIQFIDLELSFFFSSGLPCALYFTLQPYD